MNDFETMDGVVLNSIRMHGSNVYVIAQDYSFNNDEFGAYSYNLLSNELTVLVGGVDYEQARFAIFMDEQKGE